jgi:hypothetical protein
MHVTGLLLKQGIILFWALWLSVVWLSNICDGLKVCHILKDNWWFASGNYAMMAKTTKKCRMPAWMIAILFLGILIWQGGAVALLWATVIKFQGVYQPGVTVLYLAFLVNLSLWAAFILADELFLSYETESIHFQVFLAQLASLIVLVLLPETQ